jgi:hypothetical protein
MEPFDDQQTVYRYLAGAVAWVETRTSLGDKSLGSAFHVGEGVFATARHVVEHGVEALGTTHRSVLGFERPDIYAAARLTGGGASWDKPGVAVVDEVLFHPDDDVDVALVRTRGLDPPTIILDPYMSENSILSTVMLLGFPRIPLGPETPTLLAATAQVNAVVDLIDGQPTLVLSSIARAGLSGGLVANSYGGAIGLITRSLVVNDGAVEAGYLAAVQIRSVCECVRAHGIAADINLV